jgi:hypothetical protein
MLPARATPWSSPSSSSLPATPVRPPVASLIVEADLLTWVTAGHFSELILKSWESIRQNGWVPAALDRKPDGTVQPGQLVRPQPFRLPLSQSNSSDSLPSLNLIVQRHHIAPEVNSTGQGLQLLAGGSVDQFFGLEREPGPKELLPADHLARLLS